MRLIGFSTGALTRGDSRTALQIMARTHVRAVELSALRQNELIPLIDYLNDVELREFRYTAFHVPSLMDRDFEPVAIKALRDVAFREWPMIMHPDAMYDLSRWEHFGDLLCIENMDKRKPIGQTVAHLSEYLQGPSPCITLLRHWARSPSGPHYERSRCNLKVLQRTA